MSAQRGSHMLLKIMADSGSYATVAGLRTKSLRFNARPVDITDMGSDGWKELLPGAGIRTAEITGSGVFRDAASDALIRTAFFAQSAEDCEIIIPDFGKVTGGFMVTSLTYSGTFNGEAQFEISLQSAGLPEFTAL